MASLIESLKRAFNKDNSYYGGSSNSNTGRTESSTNINNTPKSTNSYTQGTTRQNTNANSGANTYNSSSTSSLGTTSTQRDTHTTAKKTGKSFYELQYGITPTTTAGTGGGGSGGGNTMQPASTTPTGFAQTDIDNEVALIAGGQFNARDGSTPSFLNTAGGLKANEVDIYKGLKKKGYTEDQINEILNKAYSNKGMTRAKNYQLEDGTFTYGVYADLDNEKMDKLQEKLANANSIGRLASLMGINTSQMTEEQKEQLKDVIANKIDSAVIGLKEKYEQQKKDSNADFWNAKNDTATAVERRKRQLAELAIGSGLNRGIVDRNAQALQDTYKQELERLAKEQEKNLNSLKEEYEKNVASKEQEVKNQFNYSQLEDPQTYAPNQIYKQRVSANNTEVEKLAEENDAVMTNRTQWADNDSGTVSYFIYVPGYNYITSRVLEELLETGDIIAQYDDVNNTITYTGV